MASQPKTAIKVVFGAMTLGKEGAEQARVHDLKDCAAILDVFQKHGHDEVDTARVYGGGSSEEYLGQLDWQKRGIVMDTKFSPRVGLKHDAEGLREALRQSLAALGTKKVDMWYLHAPDRSTPYEVTLKEVNELYKQGEL
jgi:aflatoxin B1 aldehyde reductase